MLHALHARLKKITVFVSIALVLALAVPPAAQAASIGEILLIGTIEYVYLQKTLSNYHYKQNDKIMADYKKQYGVNEDARANEQLNRVMTNLLTVIKKYEKVEPEYSWFVNKEETFNAFCGLGNNVSVNIGLFKYLNYNEDELAFVLAHEIIHGQKQHSLKSVKKIVPISVAQSLYVAKNPNVSAYILSSIAANMAVARYSTLPQEKEADNLSYKYAVEAGYNPGAGAAIWARVLAKSGDNAGNAFEKIVNPNDHPTNSQRVAAFATRMTEHSRNMIKVQSKAVYVGGKTWTSPAAAYDQLDVERTYLIAGNLAAVFHDNPKGAHAYTDNGAVKMDGRLIMTPAEGDADTAELAAKLNEILGF